MRRRGGGHKRQYRVIDFKRNKHGVTATVNYTFAKAIDNAALGGRGQGATMIAQNWLDLAAERGLSNFDQRHLLSVQGQYSRGTGIGGGTLMSGWHWRCASCPSAGSA